MTAARVLFLALSLASATTAAAAQTLQPDRGQTPPPSVRKLSMDEAVRLALENNLGIQVARIDPALRDLTIAQVRGVWSPSFTSTFQNGSTDTPANSFLSGGATTKDARFAANIGVQQALRWGGSYSLGWDSARSTTTNLFSNFSPQLRSSLALHYAQPLARNFGIDANRQQLLVGLKNRDVSDLALRQTVAVTTRDVRNAYWDLAYAIASLQVQQQSLDLAQESLRNTRSRVEIGTTPPIDIVEAEAEVATRQESVILAEAQIEASQDVLRALIFNPSTPGFWEARIEPEQLPAFQTASVDVVTATASALERRLDLQQARVSLEAEDVNIRYFRNQTLPDVTASIDYGLTGLGGTQFIREAGFPGPVVGQTVRGLGSVLGDLFGNQYPNWTLGLSVSYPIGTSGEEASLARARLQYSQAQTQLKNQELQVSAQVRSTARQVVTNQQRVQTTRASRELANRRLDAEQKKFAAGTSTSFFVFQAQRDLAIAQNNELRAVLDYNRSLVDLGTVQEVPLK